MGYRNTFDEAFVRRTLKWYPSTHTNDLLGENIGDYILFSAPSIHGQVFNVRELEFPC